MLEVRIEPNRNADDYARDFDKAVKRFKKICSDDGFMKEIQDRRYFKSPAEKNREDKRRRDRMYEKVKQGYNK